VCSVNRRGVGTDGKDEADHEERRGKGWSASSRVRSF
jgi:hypothetical protein